MSDKNRSNGGEDDDRWLYEAATTVSLGVTVEDNNKEESENALQDSATTVLTAQVIHENGDNTQDAGQDDDASDSDDDDICVTIGDIKTGYPSEAIFGATPVNLNIKAAGRTHSLVGSKSKGLDLDGEGTIKGIPVLDVDVESFEEKPWRKPGADISDYFNYGFNEETWKTYSEKQRRLRGSYEGIPHIYESSKITVHKGRTSQGDREPWSDYPSTGNLYISAPRKSSGTIDVIGGQTGCISRVEGRRRHGNEGNNIQVLSETSSKGDPCTNNMSSFFPHIIPPPPFPPPLSSVSGVPPLIPPPHIPINVPPPGVPPPPLIPTLDSVRTGPPPPPYQFSTGGYPLLPPNMASWTGVMDSTKACWEYYSRQDRERDRGQERPRERGHDKERGRDREREHSPSTQAHNSEEERARHRDSGYERHHDRCSREQEERHRERKPRDKEEGRHRSSRSRRRRDDSEEDDSRRRHKHKKSKRMEEKETNREPSADQENQSGPTE